MNLDARIRYLEANGFYVGPRDPKRNTEFAGAYMVCEIEVLDEPESADAANTGYCVVGDDLEELVSEPFGVFEDLEDPEAA